MAGHSMYVTGGTLCFGTVSIAVVSRVHVNTANGRLLG